MSRKILFSMLSILAASAMVTAATWAYFTDVAQSTGNTFSTGNLDLQIDDSTENMTQNVTASFGGNDFAPGVARSGYVSLHNAGSVDMAEVVMKADQTGNPDPNLADILDLTILKGTDNTCSGGTDLTPAITTAIGDKASPLTLDELIATDYDSLPGLTKSGTAGDTYYLCLTATMKTGTGDQYSEYQGATATVDFIFKGNQDSSQN